MRWRTPGGLLGDPRALFGLWLAAYAPLASGEAVAWRETFEQGRLDPAHWQVTVAGDFRHYAVDVIDVGKRGSGDYRLRLRADTRGSRDETVKFLGVRSARAVRLLGAGRVAAELDWNDQANGSYLSAALVLSPHATATNPLDTPDWLKVEFIGVPPGRNARMVVGVKTAGRVQTLYTEGWPETNRAGRKIGLQEVMITARDRSFEVWENGQLVYASKAGVLPFRMAYLYLQMSTHSNYPARVIYFDNIRVTSGD